MKEIIKFQCEFCEEEFVEEVLCFEHETKDCPKNPELEFCKNCSHFRLFPSNAFGSNEKIPFCENFSGRLAEFGKCGDWKKIR